MTRTSSVDVLRGFALLGIGIVNLPHLALPMAAALASPEGTLDLIAKGIVGLLFEGKFFVLFSFLFGWGVRRATGLGRAFRSACRSAIPRAPDRAGALRGRACAPYLSW